MSTEPMPEMPPFPSWMAGKGVWVRIIGVLERTGTKRDADIARRLRRDLERRGSKGEKT